MLNIESDRLGPTQATHKERCQHGGIAAAAGGLVGQAGGNQAADLAVFDVAAGGEARAGDAGQVDSPGQVLATHEAKAPGLPKHAPEGGQMPVGGWRRAVLGQPGPQGLGVAVAQLMPGHGHRQRRAVPTPAGPLGPVGRVAVHQQFGEELERGGHGPAGLGRGQPGQVHRRRIAAGVRCRDRWGRGDSGLKRDLHGPQVASGKGHYPNRKRGRRGRPAWVQV